MDLGSLRQIVQAIARERSSGTNPHSLNEVVSYVEKTLLGYGYSVKRHPVEWEGSLFWNLIAAKNPSEPSPLVVGAHYDAVENSPGADDNASGVAVLLEAARVLKDHPVVRKIRWVAFTLEESGLIGSTQYAAQLKKTGEKIRGMVSLEMVGFTGPHQSYPLGLAPFYPAEGRFIGVGANRRSRSLLKTFVQGMREVKDLPVETIVLPGNGWVLPAVRLSDHAPFWDTGYPALLVTDTSFYRNPNYHQPTDTVGTLNFSFLAQVAQAVVQGILTVVHQRHLENSDPEMSEGEEDERSRFFRRRRIRQGLWRKRTRLPRPPHSVRGPRNDYGRRAMCDFKRWRS